MLRDSVLLWEGAALGLGGRTGETDARVADMPGSAGAQRLGASIGFTAHHADDQAETCLMRLLAGVDPRVSAGCARALPLARPSLPFARRALLEYVRARGLPVWIDPANSDPVHLRSWIRVEALPFLRRRLPKVNEHLLRSGVRAGRDRDAWDAVLDRLRGSILARRRTEFPLLGTLWRGMIQRWPKPSSWPSLGASVARSGPLARLGACVGGAGDEWERIPLGAGWRAELDFGRLRISRDESWRPRRAGR